MKHASTILIVDDEPVGRQTLEALLFAQGYNLVFAANGTEALARASESAPDLILLDVMMPDMDGFEVCERLRADPLLADVPIIMVTALDDRDSRLQGIESGADDFITKPYDRVELRARVQTITRLNRYRRLLMERNRFEWVVEHARDGYLVLDDKDRVLYANPQARMYLGLQPADPGQAGAEKESPQEPFTDLVRKQYLCEPQEAWDRWAGQPADTLPSSLFLVCPESSGANAYWLRVDRFDVSSGTDTNRIVHLYDVTAEMTQHYQMRSFHEIISHKMRTPIVGMLGGLELLTKYGTQLSPNEVVELSAAAFKSAQRLRSTIEDILQYLDAPGLAEASERFSLSQLGSLVDEIGSHLEIKPATVSCPEELSDSRLLLSQRAAELALWEILENAKKFHPESDPQVEVAVLRSGPREIDIQIRDDGQGISPEHLQRIWVPYYQGEKYFTGEAQGMGLGLPTVATLVWGAGGTCRLYNREDRPGIVVELTLSLETAGEQL